MEITLSVLRPEHQPLIENFDCIAEDKSISCYKNQKRKKLLEHSEDLNNFIKKEAINEQEQGLSTTHLLIIDGNLIGYISLCTDNLRLSIEEKGSLNLSHYNIPAVKIARMAIQKDFQFCGHGEMLIQYAINISNTVRDLLIGIKFITVDCYEHRATYYEKYGFIENQQQDPERKPHHPKSYRLDIDDYLEKYKAH